MLGRTCTYPDLRDDEKLRGAIHFVLREHRSSLMGVETLADQIGWEVGASVQVGRTPPGDETRAKGRRPAPGAGAQTRGNRRGRI
jgi:predicted GNAT family N-acyltransferase